VAVGGQALLTYVPLFWLGADWTVMSGPMAGVAVVELPRPLGWYVYGLVIVGSGVIPLVAGVGLTVAVTIAAGCTATGLACFALARHVELAREVRLVGAEACRHAVAQERMRVARDLHDQLGYSISAITLKGELAYRLFSTDPNRARAEISSLLEVSRQALADVRLISSTYREMSLTNEVEAATQVLAAAEIAAEMDISALDSLPPAIDTLLATALREGITNVLRHSSAQKCSASITYRADSVQLMLANDGVRPTSHVTSPHGGNGIRNLAARLTSVGGQVNTHIMDGQFYLIVEIPLSAETRSGN
jgi:two-component system sensor histidine kinase DesK